MVILWFFLGTLVLVLGAIELGYRIGCASRRRSNPEKESPVSAIEGSVLALLAFILAFTFGSASDRFDQRKELVRNEANTLRTIWYRSDFLPEPDRGETQSLLRRYVQARVDATQGEGSERIAAVVAEARRIQRRLWEIAEAHARTDMPSDIAALYLEALNEASTIHASRVAMGLQMRIPIGVWLTLATLAVLGMSMVGYQAGIADSRRTLAMPVLAMAFACVVSLIASLDQPIRGFTLTRVSQQPLVDLLSDFDAPKAEKRDGVAQPSLLGHP